MAFNPFTSFRKYQKFWMACILLLCMVTFVLCTGVGGDLSDRLLRWFGGSRGNVNRALRNWERSQWIAQQDRSILVLNREKL